MRALISVTDKSGLAPLAQGLVAMGWELVASGGTARFLQELGLEVCPVEAVTAFPECLNGRVKTLHPAIHAGVLARQDQAEDMATLKDLNIKPFNLIVVNLYAFAETVAKKGHDLAACIEEIDIGGPTLLRAAAKNHQSVTVVVDPADYESVLTAYQTGGPSLALRRALAWKVFSYTAAYDAQIQRYLRSQLEECSVNSVFETLALEEIQSLRYGENPGQSASVYASLPRSEKSLALAKTLQGKALSYNNLADAEAAVRVIRDFQEPTVVSLKHATPCGLATASNIEEAYRLAYEADPVSIYGGIVAQNRPVTAEEAQDMGRIFLEIVLAPAFSDGAREILAKKKNLRLIELPELLEKAAPEELIWKSISGGFLCQSQDASPIDEEELQLVVGDLLSPLEQADCYFGMKLVKHVRSNAIVCVSGQQSLGVGGGQCNRVTAARLALEQAGTKARGAVLASDAFLPFADTVDLAAAAGIAIIVQPGGSIRDEEVIAACREKGIRLVMTGQRHFRH